MVTRIRPAPKELYEEDFWIQRQAELLRPHRFEDLDLVRLIEEMEELGDTVRRRRCSTPHIGYAIDARSRPAH